MEKGSSTEILALKDKLEDQNYMDSAIRIIAEQLVHFFYSEWDDDEPQ